MVAAGPGRAGGGVSLPGPAPHHPNRTPDSLPGRARAGTVPSTTPVGRRVCWQLGRCGSERRCRRTPSSASCRESGDAPGWAERGRGQPGPACPSAGRRWFHGKISGQEAVQQLQPPEDGLFLVRESARHPGDYVLCVSFGRDVIHYRVLHRDGHLTIDEAVCFCNLMDMVEVRPPPGPGPPEPHGLHTRWRCKSPSPPPPHSGNQVGPGHPKLRAQSQCGKEELVSVDHQPHSWSESSGSTSREGLGWLLWGPLGTSTLTQIQRPPPHLPQDLPVS